MAGLSEDAQWIILMGFIVSFSFFFLALVINESTVVGQTTSESVIEFPKNDIRDVVSTITGYGNGTNIGVVSQDIVVLSMTRKTAVVQYNITPLSQQQGTYTRAFIHYNNGVTEFDQNWTSP